MGCSARSRRRFRFRTGVAVFHFSFVHSFIHPLVLASSREGFTSSSSSFRRYYVVSQFDAQFFFGGGFPSKLKQACLFLHLSPFFLKKNMT
jgi:hypothetical protein